MEAFEFLSGLIKLNLSGLGLSNLLFELFAFVADFDGQLFNLESELLDLGLVSTTVLLKGEVVLFLLASGKGPLFEFLLIPVHLKFELVHTFVGLEDHVLDVVEAVLLVSNTLLELLNFILKAAGLPLGDLLHVLFGFNFLIFGVDKGLGVYELHFNRLQMLGKDLQALLMLLDFETELGDKANLLSDDLVQLLVLVVGIWWEILVEVVLCNCVYDVFCHFLVFKIV